MAKIEDLIGEISDSRLRLEISREVAALKKQKKFGLVFEEHIPETVQIPSLPVRPRAIVAKRDQGNRDLFVVEDVSGKKARIRKEGQEHPLEEVSTDELIVIKRFGDPIYPTLVPVSKVTRGKEKPFHTLINADNFHALQLLLYCYEGQVDVIYIDPPYNTGARDWKYNNSFVDSNDQWRHSKWLSMMKKRLQLARTLLRDDGVLIVTIDDYENHHLQVLLEEIFPSREMTSVVIVHNPRGNVSNNFAYTHEYAHFLIGKGQSAISRTRKESAVPRKLRRWGHNSTRKARPTMFYPIYIKGEAITRIGEVPPNNFHPKSKNVVLKNGEVEVWPIDQEGVERRWNFSLETIKDELDRISPIKVDDEWDLFVTEEDSTPKTVWTGGDLEAGKYGASLVKTIIEREFPFPKSVYAVKKCIELVVRDRKNALILDFFAGSGTTFHSTALLNSEDGGTRRCILVTNNEVNEKVAKNLNEKGLFPGDPKFEENGICESVTWPRCKYVTQGHRDDKTALPGSYLSGREMKEGFEENLEYFRLDFLDPHEVAYGEKFESILPVLWLMAGAKGSREIARGYGKWFLPKNSPYAVLIKEDAFAEFKREIKDRADIKIVFLVTDSEEAYREMSTDLPTIPETKMLYKSYLDNFRINIERA